MSPSEATLKSLEVILKRVNTDNQMDIDVSSQNYVPSKSFQLYVGIEGVVVGVDKNGNPINRHFIVGYHPISFKQVTSAGTTATSLAALF